MLTIGAVTIAPADPLRRRISVRADTLDGEHQRVRPRRESGIVME